MSTNFYLKRVRPREVRDEYHIGKRSLGWKPLFEGYEANLPGWATVVLQDDEDPRPSVHSTDDIERLLESGEWQLADEYGTEWPPGEESLEAFRSELRDWDGGSTLEPKSHAPYGAVGDAAGHEFLECEFS